MLSRLNRVVTTDVVHVLMNIAVHRCMLTGSRLENYQQSVRVRWTLNAFLVVRLMSMPM